MLSLSRLAISAPEAGVIQIAPLKGHCSGAVTDCGVMNLAISPINKKAARWRPLKMVEVAGIEPASNNLPFFDLHA